MMTSTEQVGVSVEAILIYTWVVYGVIIQMINVFGIGTNIVNIICFIKQGFKDSVNVSLLGLTISDLGSLTTMFGTCFFLTPSVIAADLSFDPVEVTYLTTAMLHFSFTRVSGCITAMITLERCLCITAPLKIKHIITSTRMTVITVSTFIIIFFTSAPIYVVNGLEMTFSPVRNKTLLGLVSTEDREHVEKIVFAINNFFIPICSFVIIVVCTTILAVKLRTSTEWRMQTINTKQVDIVSRRNKKAAKMVVMISILFIVCFIPVTILMLVIGFVPDMSVNRKYFNIALICYGLGYIMECINSSMNIFIYYHMSSKFKDIYFKLLIAFKLAKTI